MQIVSHRLLGDRLLNRFFDCTAGAVEEAGGEPLTFIGDGVLAIFPLDALGEEGARAAAIQAARLATKRLEAYNVELRSAGRRALSFGVALRGSVVFGGSTISAPVVARSVVGEGCFLGRGVGVSATTLADTTIRVRHDGCAVDSGMRLLGCAIGNGARIGNASIIQTDIATSNGVIHVIDTVLLP